MGKFLVRFFLRSLEKKGIGVFMDKTKTFCRSLGEIYGIGTKRSYELAKNGIFKVKDLASADPLELNRKTKFCKKTLRKWIRRAKARVSGKTFLLAPLPMGKGLTLDIETSLDHKFVWMIGIYDPYKDNLIQFTARGKNEEKQILKDFYEFTKGKHGKFYYYSGSDFDKKILARRLNYYGLEPFQSKLKDVFHPIRRNLVVPIGTYSLKPLGDLFNYQWRQPDIKGSTAPTIYREYLRSKDQEKIGKLKEYNQDDCLSLAYILDKLQKMIPNEKYSRKELAEL